MSGNKIMTHDLLKRLRPALMRAKIRAILAMTRAFRVSPLRKRMAMGRSSSLIRGKMARKGNSFLSLSLPRAAKSRGYSHVMYVENPLRYIYFGERTHNCQPCNRKFSLI